eukprot:415469-Alexandrium_andersonii.AAC.1
MDCIADGLRADAARVQADPCGAFCAVMGDWNFLPDGELPLSVRAPCAVDLLAPRRPDTRPFQSKWNAALATWTELEQPYPMRYC